MDKVNYDKATFSLAIIDIDLYTDSLQNIDMALGEARENMQLILSHNDENLVSFLQEYSLNKFEDAKQSFKNIRSKIDKYRNKLIDYFKNNLIAKDTFNLKVKILNDIIREKELFIDEHIKKCNEYIAKNFAEKNRKEKI